VAWYWIRKLQARVLAGDYEEAMSAEVNAERLLWTSPFFFERAEFHFYAALARAGRCDAAPAAERARHLDALAAHHRQFEEWAANCEENFADRTALVGAEVARLQCRDADAMRLYDRAIEAARTTASSTTRLSGTSSRAASVCRADSRRSRVSTCAMPGTDTWPGVRMAKCGSSISVTRT
jgi:hypothetical protein